MLDFEAFGQSIDADLSKTPWPPTGPSATTQSMTRPPSPTRGGYNPESTIGNQPLPPIPQANGQMTGPGQTLTGMDMNMLEPDLGWGLGVGMGDGSNGMNDGFGWLSGVGATGGFPNDGDMMFAQDSFWSVNGTGAAMAYQLTTQAVHFGRCAKWAITRPV